MQAPSPAGRRRFLRAFPGDHLFRSCLLCSACGAHSAVLLLVTICLCAFSDSLRAADTQYHSTAVRATTSLGGERAHQRCLFSPLPTVFSRALFSTTLPSLVGNEQAKLFPRFQPTDFIPLCFVQHHGNVQLHIVPHRGMGKEESGGLGEKTRKGKGDAAGLPPFPWVVSPR